MELDRPPEGARRNDYDAVVVGAGPNGLVAAIRLAGEGRHVTVFEAASRPGGGLRSEALTTPGFVHDVCSAVHPLALASPALRDLPLEQHGLRWLQPRVELAHPQDGGRAALVMRSVEETATGLGDDGPAWRRLFDPLVAHADEIMGSILSPVSVPRAAVATARFGLAAVRSARSLTRQRFDEVGARALIAGSAAHAMMPLDAAGSAGYGLVLTMLAHAVGWPVAEGGSQGIADALVAVLEDLGGTVVTGHEVRSLAELPSARSVLLDLTPRQVLRVAGDALPTRYARTLRNYRYGPGVFKVDWALDGPVPWSAPGVSDAATVHIGGTFEEIAAAEADVAAGRHPERPFVIFVQPGVIDASRAPHGAQTAWAYCHVPNGSTLDRTDAVESQIERFAPGFRDRIVARHTMDTVAMEAHDANYVGGDIAGGAGDIRQLVRRPVLSVQPWVTPVDGLYLCSSSTPPGAGVHGMCGWHAAGAVLRRDGRVALASR